MKQNAYAIENHPMDSRVKLKDDGICETLNARCGTGGGNVPLVLVLLTESQEVCSKVVTDQTEECPLGRTSNRP